MDIIAYPQAREVMLVSSDQFLPPSGLYLPDLLSAIAERYEFQKAPQSNVSLTQILTDGIKFEIGKLPGELAIQEFTAYNNGLVVVANKTEDAQTFLQDFFDWGELMFELRTPVLSQNRVNRLCGSQVVVRFEEEESIHDLLGKFQSLAKLIEAQMRQLYPSINGPLYVKSLSIDYDKSTVPSSLDTLASFFIERRLGTSYVDNVFFSQAPLPTDQHVEYLTDLEILLRRP